jgi:hypothetical protein
MRCVTTMDKKQLVKLVSAFSMADVGLYKRSENGNAYFMMNMLRCHEDYVDWVKETLEELVHVNKTPVANPCKRPQTNLNSRTHPFLTKLHGRIYRDKYKGLDEHAMKMFDWEMMAIFYMADGGLHVEPPNPKKGLINPSPNVTLNMKRLSYGDALFLKKTIRDALGVEFNVAKHFYKGVTYYYLRLRNKDIAVFMEGVRPHMKQSFHYKLYDSERKAPAAERPGDDIV